MEKERIKQRLVGAVVLVALGVIFIPMILSGDREDAMPPFGSNIPEQPRELTRLKKMEMPPAPSEPEVPPPSAVPIDEHTPADSEPEVAAKAPDAEPDPGESAAADTPPAWVVQVASFSNRNNALSLRKQLQDKQFNAFVEKVATDSGTLYRVRVGPQARREVAEQQQQRIAKAFDLEGVVMRHP